MKRLCYVYGRIVYANRFSLPLVAVAVRKLFGAYFFYRPYCSEFSVRKEIKVPVYRLDFYNVPCRKFY